MSGKPRFFYLALCLLAALDALAGDPVKGVKVQLRYKKANGNYEKAQSAVFYRRADGALFLNYMGEKYERRLLSASEARYFEPFLTHPPKDIWLPHDPADPSSGPMMFQGLIGIDLNGETFTNIRPQFLDAQGANRFLHGNEDPVSSKAMINLDVNQLEIRGIDAFRPRPISVVTPAKTRREGFLFPSYSKGSEALLVYYVDTPHGGKKEIKVVLTQTELASAFNSNDPLMIEIKAGGKQGSLNHLSRETLGDANTGVKETLPVRIAVYTPSFHQYHSSSPGFGTGDSVQASPAPYKCRYELLRNRPEYWQNN